MRESGNENGNRKQGVSERHVDKTVNTSILAQKLRQARVPAQPQKCEGICFLKKEGSYNMLDVH